MRFELRRAPPGWYLKSAMVNGVEAAEYPVTFGPGGIREGEIEVVVARGGRISGRATDPRGGEARDYSVVVFSTDASRWYYRSRALKQVRADGATIDDMNGVSRPLRSPLVDIAPDSATLRRPDGPPRGQCRRTPSPT